MQELQTWADLAEAILAMTPEERQQRAKITFGTNSDDEVATYCPIFAMGTAKDFQWNKTRDCEDNEHHEDAAVLLVDYNPFSEDGVVAYDLLDDSPIYITKRSDMS